MKDKFKRIKDRQYFFLLLSELTGCKPKSIENNWFGKLFIAVPKNFENTVDILLDKFIEMEKEKFIDDRNRNIKYFG